MMYVEFMKNFHVACWKKLMAVRLISAFWAQKHLSPNFYTCSSSSSWNIFFSLIRASYWLLDSFRRPEPKNAGFLLSRHDVCRLHEKFSSRRFARAIGCYIHLDLITPKTFDSYFLDMMYVGLMKNFLLADSCELLAVRLSLSSWGQKRLIPTF